MGNANFKLFINFKIISRIAGIRNIWKLYGGLMQILKWPLKQCIYLDPHINKFEYFDAKGLIQNFLHVNFSIYCKQLEKSDTYLLVQY